MEKSKNSGKIRFYPHSTSFYPINSFFTILTIWAPVPGRLPGNRKNIQIPDVMGLPQSCNASRTETYHVQIAFNVFKKICAPEAATHSGKKSMRNIFPILQISKIISHNKSIGKSIGPSKISKCSPLKCLKFGTDVPNLEDLSRSNGAAFFVSANGAGRNVEKTNGGEVQVLEVYEVLIIGAYCWFMNMSMQVFVEGPALQMQGPEIFNPRMIPCGSMLSYFQVGTRKTVWPFWENTHQLQVPKNVAAGAAVYNFCSNPFYVFIYVAHGIYPFIIIQWIYPFVIRILSNPLIFIVTNIFEFFAKRIGKWWNHSNGPLPARLGTCHSRDRGHVRGVLVQANRSRNRCQMDWFEGKVTKGQNVFPKIQLFRVKITSTNFEKW